MKEAIQLFISKFYQAIILILLVLTMIFGFGWFCQTWYTNHLSKKINESDAIWTAKLDAVKGKLIDLYVDEVKKYNEISADLAAREIKISEHFEVVNNEKDRIKTNVIYRNVCSDDAGRSLLNNEIKIINSTVTSKFSKSSSEAE